MSIALMTLAWKTNLPSTKKLAMLAMCDWANDDGGSLHPSVARLAERLSCSTRQAQRVLHELIDDGWIAVVANHHGGAPGMTRHYMIDVEKLRKSSQTGDIDVTGDIGVTGDIHVARRVTSTSQTGDIDVTQTIIDPSIDPSIINKRTVATRRRQRQQSMQCPHDVNQQVFADWLEVRKAKRAGPVTQTVLDGIRREANKAGISLEEAIRHCCLAGWQGFRAAWYLGSGRTNERSSIHDDRAEVIAVLTGRRAHGRARVIDVGPEAEAAGDVD